MCDFFLIFTHCVVCVCVVHTCIFSSTPVAHAEHEMTYLLQSVLILLVCYVPCMFSASELII